jgi:hypothetical protein
VEIVVAGSLVIDRLHIVVVEVIEVVNEHMYILVE